MYKDEKAVRILVLGDVVGNPGRHACISLIPRLRAERQIDLVIANVENIAGGSGITDATTRDLFLNGVDLMTSGDHAFRKKEAETLLSQTTKILRPANYPEMVPGKGSAIIQTFQGIKVGVINLMGRVFLKTVECPFQVARREIAKLKEHTDIILVDFHAEATSEKIAMGWFLDGSVSAVYGTHTHVQTADEQILPHGTGYVTDLGMCGPHRSVIGRSIDDALKMFLTQLPVKLNVAEEDARISGAVFDINRETGKTMQVCRLQEKIPVEIFHD